MKLGPLQEHHARWLDFALRMVGTHYELTKEERAKQRSYRKRKKERDRAQLEAKERRESTAALRSPSRGRDTYFGVAERSIPLKDAEELRRDVEEDHEPEIPDEPPPGWAEP